MFTLHRAEDRFQTRTDWLDSRHAFSFAEHFDPARLGFGPLRVVNDDRIAPRSGFPPHAHRDMEILTWIVSGSLTHEDSEGHRITLGPGHAQRMRAGRGIVHSEMNLDATRPLHLLQIWIEPAQRGLVPGHEERLFTLAPGQVVVVASEDGAEGGLSIARDARVLALRLERGDRHPLVLDPARSAWLQVVQGAGRIGTTAVAAGDALAVEDESGLEIEATAPLELLVFDLSPRA